MIGIHAFPDMEVMSFLVKDGLRAVFLWIDRLISFSY
jgi:hypothetical protein